MGLTRLKIGDVIPLSWQSGDRKTDLYAQAIVREADGTPFASSPVDLVHIGDGMYSNRALLMPNNAIVTVQFNVYSDSGHTILLKKYQGDLDIFVKEDEIDGINRNDEIFITADEANEASIVVDSSSDVTIVVSEDANATILADDDSATITATDGDSATVIAKDGC